MTFLFSLMFFLQQNWRRAEQFLSRSGRGCRGGEERQGERGEMDQTIYTHMNKCINNKKSLFSFKNKEQEGKTGPVWGLVPVGGGRI
jgi:hypothetical protein